MAGGKGTGNGFNTKFAGRLKKEKKALPSLC
jgi:hypothetical protein